MMRGPKLRPSHTVALDALALLRRIGVTPVTTDEVTEVVREAGHTSYGRENLERALRSLEERHHRVRRVGARWELA